MILSHLKVYMPPSDLILSLDIDLEVVPLRPERKACREEWEEGKHMGEEDRGPHLVRKQQKVR